MAILETNSEVCNLRAKEERILASFTRPLIEIASVAGARGSWLLRDCRAQRDAPARDRTRPGRVRRRRELR